MLNRLLHFGPHTLTFWPLANPMLTQCFQPMHAACYVPQNTLEALKQAHSILFSRWQVQTPTYAVFALPLYWAHVWQTNALYEIFTLLPWQPCWNWSQGSLGIWGLKPITAEGRLGCQHPAPCPAHNLQRKPILETGPTVPSTCHCVTGWSTDYFIRVTFKPSNKHL